MDINHLKLLSKSYKKSLIFLILCISFLVFFDWDWCRPALERYLSTKSHRVVKASSFDIEFSWILKPTIRVKDVYIENAAWSDKRPFINAKEIAITFSGLATIFEDKHVVSEIYLSDAEVNLESLEDGLRNWRLTKPNYKGPGKYKIRALRANRSTIHFNNRAVKLNGVMVVSPSLNQATEAALKDKQKLSNTVAVKGVYRDIKFDILAFTPELITIQETKVLFPIKGELSTPNTHIAINGNVADVYIDQLFDGNINISGKSFADAFTLVKLPFAKGPHFDLSSTLHKSGNVYQFTNMMGKLGSSDFKGSFSYTKSETQPSITGVISSESIHLNDIPTYISNGHSKFLKNGNMDLSYKAGHLIEKNLPKISDLEISVKLKNGYLSADDVTGKIDKGGFQADFILDSTKSPRIASANVKIQQIPINSLLNSTYQGKILAPLSGNIVLKGEGESFSQILKTLSGDLFLRLGGGVVSSKLDAKLGLDFGKMFWLSIKGDKNIPLKCGVLKGQLKNGVSNNILIIFETAETALNGKGSVDFLNRQVDLTLTHETKKSKLLSLSSPMYVHGPLLKPKVDLKPRLAQPNKNAEGKTEIQRCASS